MPVVLEPGSSLTRRSSTTGFSTERLNMIVNWYILNIAALPASSSILALASWHGASGTLFVSTTKTDILNFLSDPGNPGDVRLDNVLEWFNARSTDFTLVHLFNHEP